MKPPRGAGPHSLLMGTTSVLDLFTGIERQKRTYVSQTMLSRPEQNHLASDTLDELLSRISLLRIIN